MAARPVSTYCGLFVRNADTSATQEIYGKSTFGASELTTIATTSLDTFLKSKEVKTTKTTIIFTDYNAKFNKSNFSITLIDADNKPISETINGQEIGRINLFNNKGSPKQLAIIQSDLSELATAYEKRLEAEHAASAQALEELAPYIAGDSPGLTLGALSAPTTPPTTGDPSLPPLDLSLSLSLSPARHPIEEADLNARESASPTSSEQEEDHLDDDLPPAKLFDSPPVHSISTSFHGAGTLAAIPTNNGAESAAHTNSTRGRSQSQSDSDSDTSSSRSDSDSSTSPSPSKSKSTSPVAGGDRNEARGRRGSLGRSDGQEQLERFRSRSASSGRLENRDRSGSSPTPVPPESKNSSSAAPKGGPSAPGKSSGSDNPAGPAKTTYAFRFLSIVALGGGLFFAGRAAYINRAAIQAWSPWLQSSPAA